MASAVAEEFYTSIPDEIEIPMLCLYIMSCLFSMAGSGCIIVMCWRKMDQILQRLLLGLSIADFLLSCSLLASPFSVPSGLVLSVARGSFQSCAATGFFVVVFQLVTACYNCYISIYYLAIVRYNWKENVSHTVTKVTISKWEALVHCVAVALPVALGIVAITTESLNPTKLLPVCHIEYYPWGCGRHEKEDEYSQAVALCERSDHVTAYAVGTSGNLYLALLTVVSLSCTIVLFFTVRKKLRQSLRFSHQSGSPNEDIDNLRGSTNNEQHPFVERIKRVRVQSTLYALTYLHTILWPIILVVMSMNMTTMEVQENRSEPKLLIVQFLAAMFFPLQGFFNFCVYTRQKRIQWRAAEPELCVFRIWYKIVAGENIPSAAARRLQRRAKEGGPSSPSTSDTSHSNLTSSITTL